MEPTKKPKTADTAKEHTVSSGGEWPRRSISFTVPALKRPHIDFKRIGKGAGASGIILALVVGLVGGFAGGWAENHNSSDTVLNGGLSKQQQIVTSESRLVNSIAKTVGSSVVSINVTSTASTENFFGFSQPTQEQAAGTGIIISSDGLVITNRHVVPAGTTSISVTLSDGTELSNVEVVGRTADTDSLDVAFLKIKDTKGHSLQPAVLGDSSKIQVGDAVVAIGNALGQFQNTVTSGIISGFGRSVQAGDASGSQASENLDDLFQTDAAINEGNSGGPLTNLNGQVIGINTAVAGGAQNIGFAIPINDVKGLVDQVLKTGKFARPYLGVRYIPLTADTSRQYGLSVDNGAFVAPPADASQPSIVPGSPADNAGLQEGDVITKVDGTAIDQNHSLTALLDQHQVGDKVTLTVVRDGKTITVNATLGAAPSS